MIAAGGRAPSFNNSSRRNNAVGALPMATTAPSRRLRQSSSAAALRVVPVSAAIVATLGSVKVQTTALLAGRRASVTPCATMLESHRIGAPPLSAVRAASTKPGENTMSSATSTMPQA